MNIIKMVNMKKAMPIAALTILCLMCALSNVAYAAPNYIKDPSNFPAYPYNTSAYKVGTEYVGCGPTTGAMDLAYFAHEFGASNLLTPPTPSTVNEGLATAWELNTYMKTGTAYGHPSGFGSPLDIEPGLENYAKARGYEIKVMIHSPPKGSAEYTDWYNFWQPDDYGAYGDSWTDDAPYWIRLASDKWDIDQDKFCDYVDSKLAAGICIFLTVDSTSPEGADHWIPCVGYDKAAHQYICYNTYDLAYHSYTIAGVYASSASGDWAISMIRTVEYIGPIQEEEYDVTINAHCNTEAADVIVAFTKDVDPTVYNTPYTFTDLTGTHTFTVAAADPSGHPFKQWSTGETITTITVNSGGTYTAYYELSVTPVIPEVPLGTIMISFSMIIALAGYVGIKRFRLRLRP
jgi:hypothetical protein